MEEMYSGFFSRIPLILLAGLLGLPSAARAGGLFGPEWTVTNPELIEAGRALETDRSPLNVSHYEKLSTQAKELWKLQIKKRCPGCRIDAEDRVWVNDEVWFQLEKDAWVLEVTAKPMDVAALEKHRKVLQELVWNAARDAGLEPHWRVGGGHIHLDLATHFKGDSLLFRNFVVDLANRPELFLGALGLDLLNGPPIAILPRDVQQDFKLTLELASPRQSIPDFMSDINDLVYHETFHRSGSLPQSMPEKFQALNFTHTSTVEIRGLRPQLSMDHYLKLVRLLEARIAKLRELKAPLRYVRKDYSRAVSATTERAMETYAVDIDPLKIRDEFRKLVEESGLAWKDYAPLMTEELKRRLLIQADHGVCREGFRTLSANQP